MQSAAAGQRGRWEAAWVALGLLACGLAAYGNALANPFVIDDRIVIVGDPRVHDADVGAILTQEYWPGARGNQLYRPLTLLSFALNWSVSHAAWTFRLPNLLLHVAAGLGLFLLAREVTGARVAALVAAVLFVVHPIHTTPLNQIVDRADIAAAACVLFAAWVYMRDADGRRSRDWKRPLLGAGLLAVGLLFKESAVTLVGVVAVLDVCRRRDASADGRLKRLRRRLWRCYLPMLVILVAYIVGRTAVLDAAARPAAEISALDNIMAQPSYGLHAGQSAFLARWGTPLAVFGTAGRLLVWPHPLSWDYSYAAIDSVRTWGDPRLWFGGALLLLAVAGTALSWRRRRFVCAAIGLALVTYSVVSNTLVVIGSAFAERYLYLPSAGFCLLVGVLLAPLAGGAAPPRRVLSAVAWTAIGIVCVASGVLTIQRNGDFASNAGLNVADLRTHPRAARLWRAVAGDMLNAERFPEAIRHAEQALAIYPQYVPAWRIAGLAHWRLGELERAEACLREGTRLAGADDENTAIALADIYKSRGEYARAIARLEDFAADHAAGATVHNNLAWYLITAEPANLRDPRRALPHAERAAALAPTAGDVLDTYVRVLEALGRRDEARKVLREALPDIPANDPYRAGLLQHLNQP